MKLYTTAPAGATLLQNAFIDRYMVHANGEFVKVYIYLLRCAGANMELTLSSVADVLEYTEKDLCRALSYWEKLGLLRLNYAPDGTILDITFADITALPAQVSSGVYGASQNIASAARNQAAGNTSSGLSLQQQKPDASRVNELKEQSDIRQLLFVAEQYLQRPLSSSEQEELLYYFDTLHFSVDLIEYLLEYCISKGSASRHYMRKVALAWAEAGITTVTRAREETNLYNKNYFTIMNAFGIKGRNPAAPELEMMSHWINELGFSLDIILEACRRTIQQTHQPNFQYANKILERWKKQGVQSAADIVTLDQQRRAQQKEKEKEKSQQSASKSGSNNRFNNFNQREYDYSQLERSLLNP
jgi:DnaD/phage-associated family protein